jgi:hypothetical protein
VSPRASPPLLDRHQHPQPLPPRHARAKKGCPAEGVPGSLGGGGNEACHEPLASPAVLCRRGREARLVLCPPQSQRNHIRSSSSVVVVRPRTAYRPQTVCGRYCPWEPTALNRCRATAAPSEPRDHLRGLLIRLRSFVGHAPPRAKPVPAKNFPPIRPRSPFSPRKRRPRPRRLATLQTLRRPRIKRAPRGAAEPAQRARDHQFGVPPPGGASRGTHPFEVTCSQSDETPPATSRS